MEEPTANNNPAPAAPVVPVVPVSADAPSAPSTNAGEPGTLQNPAAPEAEQPKGFFDNPTLLIILVGIWVLFFFSWRKNKKREAQQRDDRDKEMNSLKKGDRVVTIGRVHGVVTRADDKTFSIKPDPNRDYVITFDREALFRVVKRDGEPETPGADLTTTDK